MVFESLVVDLMNKYLSAYIENLDASQLKLGIWGGDAVLENLHVKGDALKDLNLPVTIKSGFIGKLTLKIPWKNLYKDAVEATLDSLYVLAVPNTSIVYDEQKEEEKAQKDKQEQLQEIEEEMLKKLEKKDEKPKQDGFVEKLATQVIKNIQVHVKNIHVRYEDEVTVPGEPFALGVTLNSLDLQTTNKDWIPTLLDESVKVIFKMVSMNSLAVYWNTKPKILFSKLSREDQLKEFRSTIAREGFSPDHFSYIIKPVTMDAKLRLNPHPENELSKPKIMLDIVLQQLGVNLSFLQYHNVMELVESLDRMSVNAPFRKFRPDVPIKGNAKLWWKYAYNSTLVSVTRKMQMFSWEHIKEHKHKVKEYKNQYKEKLKQKKPSKDVINSLVKMENDIDVFNITLARQSAELELARSGVKIRSKKSAYQAEESSSWFGGFFNKKKQKKGDAEEKEGIDAIMDEEEKRSLYEAIGYTEGEVPKESNFPKEYVEVSIDVALNLVSLELRDDKNHGGSILLGVSLKRIKTAVKVLPTIDGISVETQMEDFIVDGLEQDGLVPRMIMADFADAGLQSSTSLLAVSFQKNPLDGSCDQRIAVSARPLKIVYNATTINNLIEFFQPPEDVQLQQIRAAAFSAYEDIREQTATGLRHAMDTRTITKISVKVMSSYVVVPKDGRYTENCEVMVLDLGEIVLQSVDDSQSQESIGERSSDGSLDLKKARSQAYDNIKIEVNKIQLLLAGQGEDWFRNRALEKSPLHILEPLSIKLLLQKCVVENDVSLPKLKIEGSLPVVSLNISDTKLKNALELVTSIPLPPPQPEVEAPLVQYDSWAFDESRLKARHLKTMDSVFSDKYGSNKSLNSSSVTTSSEEYFTAESDASDVDDTAVMKRKQQQVAKQEEEDKRRIVDVQASFGIGKISVMVAQDTPDGEKQMLQLSVENFGASAVVRTWDTGVNAYLGSIRVEYMQGMLPNGDPMYLVDTPTHDSSEKLLELQILLAKRFAPDFVTTYSNTEQILNVKLGVLQVNANSKALLEIKDFAEKLIPSPEGAPELTESVAVMPDDSKSTATLVTPVEATVQSSSGTGTGGSADESPTGAGRAKKRKKTKKKTLNTEIVNMKLTAVLENFTVNLSDEIRQIASVAIEGIAATVVLKPSCTLVNAKLHSLGIIDPFQDSSYQQIVSTDGTDVFIAEIANYNSATAGSGYVNMDNVDTSVNVRLGSLKVVFVKRFIDTMVKFGEKFQAAKEVAKEAGAAAQKAASEGVMKLVERNPRIKLNVILAVPKIFIPRNSKSSEVIAVHLGNVKISNFFKIISAEESSSPAVCENMKVEVTDIKISLCTLDHVHAIASEHQILEPVTVSIGMQRNLAASWFHGVPDVLIKGSLTDINVKISEADFAGIMVTLNENLTEVAATSDATEAVVVPVEKGDLSTAMREKEDTDMSTTAPKFDAYNDAWDKLKLDFCLPNVRVDLYMDKERECPLAELLVTNLGLDMRMGSDTSMDVVVRLDEILLRDMRSTHQEGITKYITRKLNREQSPETYKHVIHAALVQKANGAMDITASVGSLQIILCVEFILKLTSFFLNSLPKEKSGVEPVTPSTKEGLKKSESAESLLSETMTVVPRHPDSKADSEKSKAMHINFKLYQPDIILVTDMNSRSSQALVLSMKLTASVDVSESGKEQKLIASLSGLQILNCPFSAIQNITTEYKKILAPCDVKLKALLSEAVQEFDVEITKILITATPMVINTIAEVVEELSEGGQSETESKVPKTIAEVDIWDTKKVADMKFWFIESPEQELKEKQRVSKLLNKVSDGKKKMSESLKLSIPNIMILLECGQGIHTVPLLITELKVAGEVKNWSGGNMEGDFKLALGVLYFNESLSVWEPLVEPVETNPGGLKSLYELWMVEAQIQQSSLGGSMGTRMSSTSSEEDLPPLMSVTVASQKLLHTTITNDAIKVLKSLGLAFKEAAMSKREKKMEGKDHTEETDSEISQVSSEARIINMLDAPVVAKLGSELIVVAKNGSDKSANDDYTLGYQDFLAVDFAHKNDFGIWQLLSNQEKARDSEMSTVTVSMPGGTNSATFDISKTGITVHMLAQNRHEIPVVCVVESSGGNRTVTLRSPLIVKNHLSIALQVLDKDNVLLGVVTPFSSFPLPTRFTNDEKLYVKPSDMDVEKAEVDWAVIRSGDEFHLEKVVSCKSNSGQDINLNVEILSQQVNSLGKNDTCYEIHIRPVALLRNVLPYDIKFAVLSDGNESEMKEMLAGTGTQMLTARMKSRIKVKLVYLEDTWAGEMTLEPDVPELTVWTFKNEKDGVMVFGKQITYMEGYVKITLYSPYWMVNETGFPLDYKAGDDNISQHPAEKQDFILFSFTSKSFLSKNKLQLRVCNSDFSDGFSIDAVGSTGTISCKTKNFSYIVGTQITLTSFGLTKIITFSSYYTIVNKSYEDLEILEADNSASPISLHSGRKCLFWPESKTDQLKIRIKGKGDSDSANVRYSKLDSGVLVKVGDTLLFVDVSVTESSVTMTIKNYYDGSSAVLLVNHCSSFNINFGQAKEGTKSVLPPGSVKHYLWPEPTAKREISWKIVEGGKEASHDVLHEQAGVMKFKIDKTEHVVYYAVFIDGLQHILLFTENKRCADAVEQGLGAEQANLEVNVELQGLTCSITDTKAKREVMYMALKSSGIVWEEKPKKRWMALAQKYNSALEEDYQKSSKNSSSLEVEKYEFDLTKMKVTKPHKAALRRFFQPGIWLQYTVSDHQMMVHAKINRVQVDNQLPAAVFPVVLHPMPMPKTVAIDSSPKPFVEFSLMQGKSQHQTFTHIRYFKVLVQEFSVKLDMGIISALMPVFGADEIESTPERDLKYFNYDVTNSRKTGDQSEDVNDDSAITFYDLLHLSPIKVHVSFSMQNTIAGGDQTSTVVELPFSALSAVLKSVGVTVSDIDDVVFKLGYFERQYQFFSTSQFQNAITRHYAGQAIKQLYVLVFGLDVIGNPYGLVMGIAEGVTDLFYEPYQGMIQGPGEFAEGLALGAISLLGHTVGGAAGAVSRVTGALGKGVASLTMDEEYKRKRQMQKNKPADLKEGLARGGKGFVMGIVGGITGVVTKPIEGAKKDGAAGFFKGVGKGLIGIVARPASGVIDLASNTFEGIQKLADMSEDVKRMRPARWINEDTGILQPYQLKKAQGKGIQLEVEKGRFAENEKYVEHVPLDKEKKSFLMLTNKTVLEAHTGDIFGQWNSAWHFAYDEIVEEPHLTKDGIKLVGEKTKKLFGSKSHQKVIFFYDAELWNHALDYMRKSWAEARDGRETTSMRERTTFVYSSMSEYFGGQDHLANEEIQEE